MASEAALILQVLDRNLGGPGVVRLLGGAALTLAYGMARSTEDVDLVQDDAEVQALIDSAGFGFAVDAVNRELAPRGLYLTHIWGPEQLILAAGWRERCRSVELPGLTHLGIEALGPEDLVVSKLVRGDEGDFADIEYLLRSGVANPAVVRALLADVHVPAPFMETWPAVQRRLLGLLDRVEHPAPGVG